MRAIPASAVHDGFYCLFLLFYASVGAWGGTPRRVRRMSTSRLSGCMQFKL